WWFVLCLLWMGFFVICWGFSPFLMFWCCGVVLFVWGVLGGVGFGGGLVVGWVVLVVCLGGLLVFVVVWEQVLVC
ncbi:hypothetical protein RA267_28510, partial [Pseudomonas syringae pv. tagetis]|uniref:hypothetical protein n=1 Tax=Pseudomonas syringae group genomosp. 7 TaxID=251699 RepID=UPI00376F94E1